MNLDPFVISFFSAIVFSLSGSAVAKPSQHQLPIQTCGVEAVAAAKHDDNLLNAIAFPLDGVQIIIKTIKVNHGKKICAVMESPEQRALSAEEYWAAISLADQVTEAKSITIGAKTSAYQIYPGFCGSSKNPLGVAYLYGGNLAITYADILQDNEIVCLYTGQTYLDVHKVRIGGIDSKLAGLSLVRPSNHSGGFGVNLGGDINPNIQYYSRVGNDTTTRVAEGTLVASSSTHLVFNATIDPQRLTKLLIGGASFINGETVPTGLGSYYNAIAINGHTYEQYVIRRNLVSDLSFINSWYSQSKPVESITATWPSENGTVRGCWAPSDVTVSDPDLAGTNKYSIYLENGIARQPLSKILICPDAGMHVLKVVRNSNPLIRHTIQFNQRY